MSDENRLLGHRYLVQKVLGPGASGFVYLAKDTKSPHEALCAVKELAPRTRDLEERENIRNRFRDEETYLRLLDGFNGQIPKLHDPGFSENDEQGIERQYIILEYIEGSTLRRKIEEGGILSEIRVKEILLSLLPVISHIHSRGLIHRDINPSNIILRSGDGVPVLIDFGGVKEVESTVIRSLSLAENTPSSEVDQVTLVVGKRGYMAPEQEDGRPKPASDLFSLGVTTIELLSGLNPAKAGPAVLRNWLDSDHKISRPFAAIIKKAIDKQQRYTDAAEMLSALSSIATSDDSERIQQQLGGSLSRLLRRQPVTAPERHEKCAECDFYISVLDEFCSDCGTQTFNRLSADELNLHRLSPEDYVAQLPSKPRSRTVNDSWLIRLGYRIDNSDYYDPGSIIGSLTIISGIIGVIFGWTTNEGLAAIPGVIIGVVGGCAIGAASGLLLWFFLCLVSMPAVKKRRREFEEWDLARERQLEETRSRQLDLKERLRSQLETNRHSGIILKFIEGKLSSVITDFATREEKYAERLSITRKKIKEYPGEAKLQESENEFERALAEFESSRNKFQVKLLEITLIRLHNKLQYGADRGTITEADLDELVKVVNEMYCKFESVDMQSSENNINWFARVLRIRDILRRAAIQLTERTNARVWNRESLSVELSNEIVKSLDLLNAYLTYRDFYNEYRVLCSEHKIAHQVVAAPPNLVSNSRVLGRRTAIVAPRSKLKKERR